MAECETYNPEFPELKTETSLRASQLMETLTNLFENESFQQHITCQILPGQSQIADIQRQTMLLKTQRFSPRRGPFATMHFSISKETHGGSHSVTILNDPRFTLYFQQDGNLYHDTGDCATDTQLQSLLRTYNNEGLAINDDEIGRIVSPRVESDRAPEQNGRLVLLGKGVLRQVGFRREHTPPDPSLVIDLK